MHESSITQAGGLPAEGAGVTFLLLGDALQSNRSVLKDDNTF